MSKDFWAPRGQYHGPTSRAQAERAQLNAIIPEAASYDDGEQQNLEGTLLLFNSQVKVLFDTGATNSFVSFKIVRRLGLIPQTLDNALNAVSPLGATVKLGKVCKDCTLTLEDKNLLAELIVLPMKEFDVILGFDWLTKYHAKLDCVSKTITFSVPGNVPFNFQCNPRAKNFLRVV